MPSQNVKDAYKDHPYSLTEIEANHFFYIQMTPNTVGVQHSAKNSTQYNVKS